ncbi:GNAT family N-acetyltransferase [Endozoicomonas sp. 4G]|uniref:GNAT family N-acetyltransferase n=1 Tax=Endozoicomonas sp. 4G TaxID=2872754 RepID=UPI002078D275|nr:GNAT family N-acetyltransferase [Endozoicomonas sp. 4G]
MNEVTTLSDSSQTTDNMSIRDLKSVSLKTRRLNIRPLQKKDCNALFKVYSDFKAMKYWNHSPYETINQAQLHIEKVLNSIENNTSLKLAMVQHSSDELIGTINLFNIHPESRRAEIGYILSSSFWGQGLMSEALSAFIDYCFETLRLNRLEAEINPENEASSRLLKKCGFKVEGLLKERWIVDGKVTDSEIYGLLSSNIGIKT